MLDYNQLLGKLNNELLEDILKITISNPRKKESEKPHKITIEKILLKDKEVFQLSEYTDNKVFHKNIYEKTQSILETAVKKMLLGYKQMFICSLECEITVLMNKKKEFKIAEIKKNENTERAVKKHNKEKNYILPNGHYIPWMHRLGLMSRDGIVLNHMQKKFRQINKFLEEVSEIEKYIPENGVIVDMGCGKSYLTFAMYYYFNEIKGKNVKIKGFDLKADVVKNCCKLSEEFNFTDLKFYAGDIAELDNTEENINMIITLHACDTATDYALFHAIKWGCDVIMSVPCCQHELFYQIKNNSLSTILEHGILKERFSALFTDSVRASVLELCGYKVSVREFIDMEHTPKNIMIRGIKKNSFKPDKTKAANLKKLLSDFNADPTIYRLLKSSLGV